MTFPDAIEALRRRHGFRLLALGGGHPPAALGRTGTPVRLLPGEEADAAGGAHLLALQGQDRRHFAAPGVQLCWQADGRVSAWRTGRRLLAQGQGAALEGQPVAATSWARAAIRALRPLAARIPDGTARPLDGASAHDRLARAALPAEAQAFLARVRTDARLQWRAPGPLLLRRAGDLVLLLPDSARDPRDVALAWWQTP